MTDTATVDLSEAATVVVPPPKADVPVLAREDIVAADRPAGPAAARVAEMLDGLIAWHNRMPWAKRLRPEQVGQAGVVRFAFEKPQGGSGEAVVLKPLFKPEKLVAGQSAKQMLAFVRRHGLDASPAPADWPLRELAPPAGADTSSVHWRYLVSAAYPGTVGSAPLRALVGQPGKPGARVPVGGRRGISLPRVGGASAVVAGLVLAAVLGLRLSGTKHPAAPPAPAASAPQAGAPASAALPAPIASAASAAASPVAETAESEDLAASAVGVIAAPASAAASAVAAASPEPAASAASAPVVAPAAPATAHAGHDAGAGLKSGPPALPAKAEKTPAEPMPAAAHGPDAKAVPDSKAAVATAGTGAIKPAETKSESALPPVERPLPKPRPTIRPIHAPLETYDPTAAASAKANGQPAPVAKGPNFALVTAVSADAEPLVQLRRRLRQAMGREGEALQLELQPAPGGQVLALWPIASRDSATRLADTLRQAGVRMRIVEF